MEFVQHKDKKYSVPDLFRDLISESSGFELIMIPRGGISGKLIRHVKSGKFLIIDNSEEKQVDSLYREVLKRTDEILPFEKKQTVASKKFSGNRKREYDKLKNDILNKILLVCENDVIVSLSENIVFQNLIAFCGGDPGTYESGNSYLIPYKFYIELKQSLSDQIFVESSGEYISAGINVLLPKSQETTELFRSAFSELPVKTDLKILDMGCGSGVLSVLSGKIFSNSEIHFTDILPESLATSLYNIARTGEEKLNQNRYICRKPGDLFEHIDENFDIIIFNPPWVDAPARNRSELALNDKDLKTLERFLMQARHHTVQGGNIVLAFSDNSGDKAVDKFNSILVKYGYSTLNEFSAKVQSYQSGRKWMKIFVRILKSEALK